MATKRKPIHPNPLNFRPSDSINNEKPKGTRPTVAEPVSVKEMFTTMIVFLCKKSIFYDTNLKVGIYLGALFVISLIGDFNPYPKSYFSRSDNLFNVYFVKMGWFWTLILSAPYLFLTSFVLCCGDYKKIVRQHVPRIIIATGFWFIWTKFFNIIENSYGRCNMKGFDSKSGCLKAGHLWHGFDISGHAFILIYSSLVLIEEARPINNWDNIKSHLRNEEHNRKHSGSPIAEINPLRNLKDDQIVTLKYLYGKYTPAIKALFVGMTVLQVLWDVMLVCTMLYYHRMIEKVLSGIFAILTWYFTYRAWYPHATLLPDVAGKGLFTYQKDKSPGLPRRRQPSLVQCSHTKKPPIPKFMGMPIYTTLKTTESTNTTQSEQVAGPSRY